MAETYDSFMIGYIVFWTISFLVIATLLVKTNKLEKLVKNLESKS